MIYVLSSDTDVKSLDLKLDKTRVPATSTTWMCQILPWSEEGDFHVIGSKPLVDNADVTHHMIVFGCGSTGNWPSMLLQQQYTSSDLLFKPYVNG